MTRRVAEALTYRGGYYGVVSDLGSNRIPRLAAVCGHRHLNKPSAERCALALLAAMERAA